jgi:hypothetical protein
MERKVLGGPGYEVATETDSLAALSAIKPNIFEIEGVFNIHLISLSFQVMIFFVRVKIHGLIMIVGTKAIWPLTLPDSPKHRPLQSRS